MPIARELAPRALRRPISLRRCETIELIVVPTPTSVSTSTTSETTQNSVCNMVMMRVSEAVILVTCCALTCMEVISLILETSPARSLVPAEYSITSTPRVTPVSLLTSALVA